MQHISKWLPIAFVAALAVGNFAACGESAADESARDQRPVDVRAPAQGSPCPTVPDMNKAMGSEVTFTQSIGGSPWITCMYELTGRYRGVFVELSVQPASHADAVYARLRQITKGMNGQDAEPAKVDLGDGGWAFGSGSMSRAAIVSKGRLYQADMSYMGFESIGDQKDAMVRVLELAIR
jgi:hypothetical protein